MVRRADTCYVVATTCVHTVVPATCLSPQVYDLVTKKDHVIQPVDYVDDQFTIDLTVVRRQFGAGTVQNFFIALQRWVWRLQFRNDQKTGLPCTHWSG